MVPRVSIIQRSSTVQLKSTLQCVTWKIVGNFGKCYVKWPQMVLTGFKFGDLNAVHHIGACMH